MRVAVRLKAQQHRLDSFNDLIICKKKPKLRPQLQLDSRKIQSAHSTAEGLEAIIEMKQQIKCFISPWLLSRLPKKSYQLS